MYLRQKHAVLNAMKKTERDAGVVLHTKKKKKSAAASMVGRHLVRGGMEAERAQMGSYEGAYLAGEWQFISSCSLSPQRAGQYGQI